VLNIPMGKTNGDLSLPHGEMHGTGTRPSHIERCRGLPRARRRVRVFPVLLVVLLSAFLLIAPHWKRHDKRRVRRR